MPGTGPFIGIAEVAEQLELGQVRVYQLIAAKELPAVKIAGRIRIPRAAFEQWLAQKAEAALATVGR